MAQAKKAKRPAVSRNDPWSVESLAGGVARITFAHSLWVFISSDWHWDSTHCDREKLAHDLSLAKQHHAAVLSLGDGFDAMGGKFDPRSTKHSIRPELQTDDYFDACVSSCAEWLKPYREQMALITPGNHESAVRKRQETCLTTRLVERLKILGSPVRQGGYAGWVLFRSANGSRVATHSLYYHHGFGGGSPVTAGVGNYHHYMAQVDADVIVAGHIHQRTMIEAARQRITGRGIVRIRPLHLVRSASYKQESLSDGWAVEKGMGPRPLGGWWMLLEPDASTDECTLKASFHDAPFDHRSR